MSNNGAIIEVYHGAEIAFGGDGWVNATQMAKAFKKRTNDFLRLDATKGFVAALVSEGSVTGNPVTVRQGGAVQGTWMHPDLALEFARWLSPEFAIWCNRVVRRVLAGGQASVDNATILNLLQALAKSVADLAAEVTAIKSLGAPAMAIAPSGPTVMPMPRLVSAIDAVELRDMAALGEGMLAKVPEDDCWLGKIAEIEQVRVAMKLLARVDDERLDLRHAQLGWIICRYLGVPLEAVGGPICFRLRGRNRHRCYYVVRMNREAAA